MRLVRVGAFKNTMAAVQYHRQVESHIKGRGSLTYENRNKGKLTKRVTGVYTAKRKLNI